MEEVAVTFLLETVKDLIVSKVHLIKDSRNQLEFLVKELERLEAFLMDHAGKHQEDTMKVLMRQIRDVMFEAEDTIQIFLSMAAEKKTHKYFGNMANNPLKTLSLANKIIEVRGKIQVLFPNLGDFATPQNEGTSATRKEKRKEPFVRQDNIVVLEDQQKFIIQCLMEESNVVDAISIIGMPGLGKTTLAWDIFNHEKIELEFAIRKWVYVSQNYRKKDVFLSILSHFTQITDAMRQMDDQDIARDLNKYLRMGKYLIVMDDVWTADAWEDLQSAFPKENNLGKILITSRNVEVAKKANSNREPHNLRLLTPIESWSLFEMEVFNKSKCPPELEDCGRLIVHPCGNLPLAIVVIAGILVKKDSVGRDMVWRKNAWKKVSDRVKSYLKEDPEKRMENIISLSYDILPHHLKLCFLYLGMFPEGIEIPFKKLILLWIAEGFVKKNSDMSLEETAQDYLEELVNRNLVIFRKRSLDGNIKTCQVHDMLREFCKTEGGKDNEKLFQEFRMSNGGTFEPTTSDLQDYRRVCVHANVLSFLSSKLFGPRVRSFLCFSKEEIYLPPKNISYIPSAFKLVRVLDVKSIKFAKFPNDITHLVHLCYIAMSSDFKVLPDSISKLLNLQTLIIDTTCRALEFNFDFWNMINLRHVKTNASAILPKPPKIKESGKQQLQTLSMLSTESCTEEVFDRASHLKKLGIRGPLKTILGTRGLENFRNVEKLKLVNDATYGSTSEAKLFCLPEPHKFPPNLRKLTLSGTHLEWKYMAKLGELKDIEVLKLKENAFVGNSWAADNVGFPSLYVLHIERTDLVRWTGSGDHFPKLGHLILRNCPKLESIPLDLHKTLHALDLKRCKSVVDSARAIEKAKQTGFKLHIAAVDE